VASTMEVPVTFNTPAPAAISDMPATDDEHEAAASTTTEEEQPESEPAQIPFQKLHEIIENVTDAQLAQVSQALEEMPAQWVSFASGALESVDFSALQKLNTPAPTVQPGAPERQPFVPNNSFSYQVVEDTSLPKKYIMTEADKKAQESMVMALAALNELDWNKVAIELKASGKEVNIEQLQKQLKKALKEVDWNKLQTECQDAIAEAKELTQQQNIITLRLGNYQQARVAQQQKIKQAEQKILEDRLEKHEKLKLLEEEKKKCTETKAKKIIHI
jgi:hypothetical protein